MDIELLAQKFYDHSLYIRGYSKHTIARYRSVINFYKKDLHITKIEEIHDSNTRNFFLVNRIERKWSPNTFVIYHKTLVVFFRWCVELGYMEVNFTDDIETPKIRKSLPKKLIKEDALKLLDIVYNYPYEYTYLRYRNHAMFSVFIYAGLRKSELLNLRLTDVDVPNLTIFIRQGKGGKDRIIPMSFTLAHSLKRYLEHRKRLKKTCPEFFCSLNRNQGFTDSGMKRLVAKIKKVSRIDFSLHKLRHTFATLMLEGGCDIYSLSKMMGHSDIKTTTIYLSASAEHLRGQMNKHPLNK